MMTCLLVRANHSTSEEITVLSLWAALHGSVKGWVASITISPLAIVKQWSGRTDNQDT